jgi:hypothetical protein
MTQFDNIIVTPIYGPLNTSNAPNVLPRHNYGVLNCQTPNPPLFYPSQEPINTDQFVNSRKQYIQTFSLNQQPQFNKPNNSTSFYSYSTQIHKPVSTNVNYIPPSDASSYLSRKKALAVGKSSYKVGLSPTASFTTKNYYPSGVRSAVKRTRSGGCVAPAKKGSIYNTSLSNGQCCAWGSLVRSTY